MDGATSLISGWTPRRRKFILSAGANWLVTDWNNRLFQHHLPPNPKAAESRSPGRSRDVAKDAPRPLLPQRPLLPVRRLLRHHQLPRLFQRRKVNRPLPGDPLVDHLAAECDPPGMQPADLPLRRMLTPGASVPGRGITPRLLRLPRLLKCKR